MPELDSTIEYRDIAGFPGYKVGNDGSVWSRRRGGFKPHLGEWRCRRLCRIGNTPYLQVTLMPGRVIKRVPHLVLEAFREPWPVGLECCHEDGDPSNNRLGNLRWDTHMANVLDTIRHGRMARGSERPNAKLDESTVRAIRAEYAGGHLSLSGVRRKYGISIGLASGIVNRTRWKHVA